MNHWNATTTRALLKLLEAQAAAWKLIPRSLSTGGLKRCSIEALWTYSEACLLPCIAVLGPFNAGKTTLINELIGEDLLLTSIKPTTAVATVLRHIDDRPADWPTAPVCALRKNASLRSLNPADILQSFDTTDLGRVTTYGESQNWDAIVIWLSAPILKGISLVDLPGIGLPKETQDEQLLTAELEVQARVIEQVDGYLLLSNMQGPAFGDVATHKLLQLIATRGVRPIDGSCSNILLVGTNADPTRQELKDESYAIGLIREMIMMQHQRLDTESQSVLPISQLKGRIKLFFVADKRQRAIVTEQAWQLVAPHENAEAAQLKVKAAVDRRLASIERCHHVRTIVSQASRLRDSVCFPNQIPRTHCMASKFIAEIEKSEYFICESNIFASEKNKLKMRRSLELAIPRPQSESDAIEIPKERLILIAIRAIEHDVDDYLCGDRSKNISSFLDFSDDEFRSIRKAIYADSANWRIYRHAIDALVSFMFSADMRVCIKNKIINLKKTFEKTSKEINNHFEDAIEHNSSYCHNYSCLKEWKKNSEILQRV